jgi:hypothetical protein
MITRAITPIASGTDELELDVGDGVVDADGAGPPLAAPVSPDATADGAADGTADASVSSV